MLAQKIQETVRPIVYRTDGHTHGPITRLVSPSDLGEVIKPFVFLDLAEFDGRAAPMSMERGWHPHSGIATVTVMLEGAVRYAETTGRSGVLPARIHSIPPAGRGVWHTGAAEPGRALAFQLWVALPPELELEANASRYVMPSEVPSVGPARVILGEWGGAKSPIDAPPMTYLSVSLEPGERWRYEAPADHTVAWIAVAEGALRTPEVVPAGEVAVFASSEASIDFVAEGKTRFVLGSAAQHPHELVLGDYSVHTSAEALRKGEEEIRRIGRELRENGTLRTR